MAAIQKKGGEKGGANMGKYMTINEIVEITGLSRPTARKLAEDAKAVARVGRRILVLTDKFDAYLHDQAES
jgi:excisionase family DNA binding protein